MSKNFHCPGQHKQPVSQVLDSEQHPPKTAMDSPISYSDSPQPSTPDPAGAPKTPKIKTSLKGVEIAKKRLRAFSIQKKAPMVSTLSKVAPPTTSTTVVIGKLSSAKVAPKPPPPKLPPPKLPPPEIVELEKKPLKQGWPINFPGTTVVIGKLSSAKVAPKPPSPNLPPPKLPPPEIVELEKKPLNLKPPKPGTCCNSYLDLQNRTMAEIEDMKRRMEMVELGIPLGVICPSPHNKLTRSKAMPTKAMPPISVLEPEKIDEIIREAKKAKAEGKVFKFDYHKFVPGYDNPFQRKQKDDGKQVDSKPDILEKLKSKYDKSRSHSIRDDRDRYDDRKKSDRHDSKKYSEPRSKSDNRDDLKKDDRVRHRDKTRESDKNKSKDRDKDKSKDRDKDKSKEKGKAEKRNIKIENETKKAEGKDSKEADLNLNEYLVCDSWSLDTEDKMETTSPKVECISKEDDIKKLETTKVDENKKVDSKKVAGNKKVDIKKVTHKEDDTTSDYMQVDEKIIKQVVAAKEEIDMAFKDPMELFRESLLKKEREKRGPVLPKLKPVVDSFTFEIDDGMLHMFDEAIDLEKFSQCNKLLKKTRKDFDQDSQTSKDVSVDMTDDFLESVISEIKQENMSDDETCHDKALVDYDMSPEKSPDDSTKPSTPGQSNKKKTAKSGSITPEIKREMSSQRSDVSDSGFKSVESGYKSVESGYKSTETINSPDSYSLEEVEKELDEAMDKVSKATLDSLDTWSFVLKICQPLLFRHDRNKCYKETRSTPKMWYTENPKLCDCVKDRSIVYEELDACKIALVDRVYGCDQIDNAPSAKVRGWYPKLNECLFQTKPVELSAEWEMEESTQNSEPTVTNKALLEEKTEEKEKRDRKNTPKRTNDDISLDREYQRFMDAVWPEIAEPKKDSRSTTPTKEDGKKKNKKEDKKERKKAKKMKLSENWTADLEVPGDDEKSKKRKVEKKEDKPRKRKRSSSTISESTDPGDDEKKGKKRLAKKKTNKKGKVKSTKSLKMEKIYLKKLKEKQKKKAKKLKEKTEKIVVESEEEKEAEKAKKSKKKKQQKLKKKLQKKKKAQSYSSSESSSESDSESESHSEKENKTKKKTKKKDEEEEKNRKKKRKDKKKKRKQSTSESAQSDELFDVNVLNNIKTEKLDAEASGNIQEVQEFSPRRQETPRKEIIDTKELHNDFVANNIHIKQEVIENISKESPPVLEEVEQTYEFDLGKESPAVDASSAEKKSPEFKEPQESKPQPIRSVTEESNLSQSSSQESVCSNKEPSYEKDDSHLRPSSQNSNYSFNDVIASQTGYYQKSDEDVREDYQNYEMYERLAMEYQSGVANLQSSEPTSEDLSVTNRIETVVSRGEIKCDWRAGDKVQRAPPRPSRWGLKPGEANIVLTSEEKVYPIRSVLEQTTYRIESITGHGNDSLTGYDEAYADMYAASDRLQYGDCFTEPSSSKPHETGGGTSLDARIEKVLSDAAKAEEENKAEENNKNNLVTKPKTLKRVSFADGYKPGQDSDTEEPPAKKKKRARRAGCAWPCPASHPDHVPLWDALPPPPPPPGSPPPPRPALPPLHLLRHPPAIRDLLMPPPHQQIIKFDPTGTIPGILPPEPPPGMINLQHLQM